MAKHTNIRVISAAVHATLDRSRRNSGRQRIQRLRPLLLAPGGAVIVITPLLLFDADRDFGWTFATVALLGYLLILCYLLELLFVVPGLLLRPSFRQPHPILAAAFGIAISWVLPAVRHMIEGRGFSASAAPAMAAGAPSGLLFSWLARTQTSESAGAA